MAEKSSLTPAAKVVGKFARPEQQKKDVVSLSRAAFADPAPATVILLETTRLHTDEASKDKAADGNKIRADPERLTSTAAMPSAPHTMPTVPW